MEETRAFRSAAALSPSEAASRRAEPAAAPLTSSRSRTGPGSGLEVRQAKAASGGQGPGHGRGVLTPGPLSSRRTRYGCRKFPICPSG